MPQPQEQEIVMNPIRPIRRLIGVLAGLACAWLGLALAGPAAFAMGPPTPGPAGYITPTAEPPGWNKHPHLPYGHWTGPVYKAPVHAVVIGGMPGWQIALIATAAALIAATAAVLVGRARAARRKTITAAA
jgi:hypothetical protein